MLEQTLSKIGSLLALVFGEAGAEIIAKNMEKGHDVNPMLPGQKAIFIFGFCDIRNFTDATEVLEEGVMLFVNEIGDIVHNTVARYSGAANKNVGDAFLLVWKLDKQDQTYDLATDQVRAIKGLRVSQLADMSLISFLLLISGLKRNRKMLKYKKHKGLNERMANYEVRLGLGMHLGYAIEGPIGSYYKIDASYLSPNVRMSERLEGATKHYAVPILISGDLWEYLSTETQVQCRQVDYVIMNGMKDPVKLFTVDVDASSIQFDAEENNMSMKEQKIYRVHQRVLRNQLREQAFEGSVKISDFFDQIEDLKIMRQKFGREWRETYNTAFKAYIRGRWDEAQTGFKKILEMKADDQPSKLLLEFMGETNFKPPLTWNGTKPFAD